MSVNLEQAKKLIIKVIRAGLVPMVTSSPGMGKSSIAMEIANEFNLEYLDERLSYKDPVDLGGMIYVDQEAKIKKATYLPFDNFPIEGDPLPKGKDGWLLNLDEFNSAPPSVMAAAYKLVLDKCVGNHKLHKNVAIMACGNLLTDNAIVEEMGTAMQSRLVHIQVHSDLDVWMKWAVPAKIDSKAIGYLAWQPQNLNAFDPEHTDLTFPCERTWEMLSKLIKNEDTSDPLMMDLLAGTIGKGTALEFIAYSEVYSTLPTFKEILANPMGTSIPVEPSTMFALSSMLMEYIGKYKDTADIISIMQYVKRVPIDFQVLIFKHAVQNFTNILKVASINSWSFSLSKHLI